MNKTLRIAILGLAGMAFLLPGCAPRNLVTARPTTIVQSQTIALQTPQPTAPAAEPAAPQQNQAQAPTASLDGLVWNDLDRDGLQDLNETGIPNVTVNLLTSARAAAGTAITNQNGAYHFQNLVPGDYFVTMTPPPGFVFSPKDQGQNELVDSDSDPTTAETVPVTLVEGENGLVFTTGIYSPTAAVQPDPGTVRPPPAEIEVCSSGVYSLGGLSTLHVNQLAPGFCLQAFLWNHGFAIGRIPGGAGRILAEVTFLEVFYQDSFVYKYDVAGEPDSIQVCYAVPDVQQYQIYFFDFYGPRFGQPGGQPVWQPLPKTVDDEIVCAVAQTSGAYALIGK